MDLSIDLSLETRTRVSPSLIAVNHILALSSQELQEEIRNELESNPALEMEEHLICPVCGGSYFGSVCRRCLAEGLLGKTKRTEFEEGATSSDTLEKWNNPSENSDEWISEGWQSDEEEFDPINFVAAEMSLNERLLMELAAVLDTADMPIAEFLVGSLDERGYLSTNTQIVADTFNTDETRVARILNELQQIAPPGVGARTAQECLILQLHHLQEQGVDEPLVAEILEKHFTDLGERKYGFIATQLGISTDEVKQAREFIKNNLNPSPAQGQTGEINGTRYSLGSHHFVPDVMITYSDGEFKIEVVESKRFFLKVHPLYQKLFQEIATSTEAPSDNEMEHIRQYVTRARQFLANIEQRRQTIMKICEALVKIQEEFLRDGVRGLQPLTRSVLANYIGVHESTVSRATAGKYIMLPNRRVIPFSDFFHKNLSIKDMIKEIVEKTKHTKNNDKLTDQEIVEVLNEQYNVSIARRTVAKYRSQLKILSSVMR